MPCILRLAGINPLLFNQPGEGLHSLLWDKNTIRDPKLSNTFSKVKNIQNLLQIEVFYVFMSLKKCFTVEKFNKNRKIFLQDELCEALNYFLDSKLIIYPFIFRMNREKDPI